MSCCLFGCSEKLTQPEKTPVSLRIEAPSRSIHSGGMLQLVCVADFVDGTSDDVTKKTHWSIAPGSAGRITNEGCFVSTLDSIGHETVTADYQGQTDTVTIQVVPRIRSLVVWPSQSTVTPGQNVQFTAFGEFYDSSIHEVQTENITDRVDWSNIPGRAGAVDAIGLFTAHSGNFGSETIYAAYQDLTASSTVRVKADAEPSFEMVTIPAGSFIMGDDQGLYNEKPAHEVYIDAFQIGKYEVTNGEYARFVNKAFAAGDVLIESTIVTGRRGPYAWMEYFRYTKDMFELNIFEENEMQLGVKSGFEDYPVVGVTWYGAAAFCANYDYRLPTEAEWEKACRGGLQLDYGTEDGSISHDVANYMGQGGRDVYEGPAPVGRFPSNPYGLFDMSGNAAEYVFDVFDPFYYLVSTKENPIGPGPALLIGRLPNDEALWRGGSYNMANHFCRAAYRGTHHDQFPNSFIGFRVARSLQ